MPTQDQKIALVAAGLAAVVVSGVLVLGTSTSSSPASSPPSAAQQISTEHPADLLTSTVAPGAEVMAAGDLRRGWVFTYAIALTGDAIGRFDVVAVKTAPRGDGGTHVEVHAKNTSDRAVRFSAALGYTSTPDASAKADAP